MISVTNQHVVSGILIGQTLPSSLSCGLLNKAEKTRND